MHNPLKVQPAEILEIRKMLSNSKIFRIKPENKIEYLPGQIMELSIPGFGEAPFAFASLPYEDSSFDVCVSAIGTFTNKLHELKTGDTLGVRGPIGRGHFPLEKLKDRDITIIMGGMGSYAIRPLIQHLSKNPVAKSVTMYYGSRDCEHLYFQDELSEWEKIGKLFLCLDNKPKEDLHLTCEHCNLIELLEKNPPKAESLTIAVGPPIIYKLLPEALQKYKIEPKDTYFSLERRMECGIGICQHCAIGPYYVCKDGPIFSLETLSQLPDWF